jgi:hypothetical protein
MSIAVIRAFVESGKERQDHIEYEDAELTLSYWDREPKCLVLWLVIKPCSERNVSHFKQGVRSTGFMRRLMADIEKVARENGMDVGAESVYNEVLQPWFVRRGYTEEKYDDDPYPWYYRRCSETGGDSGCANA